MSKTARLALAACVTLLVATPAAFAADVPAYVPDPVPVPPPKIDFSGWYLRGDIGVTNQHVEDIDNVLFDTAAQVELLSELDFDSGGFGGVGLGYRFNKWLRFDVTGEYRGKTTFDALDRYDIEGDGFFDGTNQYTAKKSEWVFLANAYADLGTYYGISPYVGAGIGATYNTIHGLQDTNVPNLGVAFAEENSEWDLAWALYAGVGYNITPNLALDLGYRYIHLGDASSGDITTFTGVNAIDNPLEFSDITSHDFRIGVRYTFGGRHHAAPHHGPVAVNY